MARMVEVTIDSVRVSLTNQQRIVVLRQTDVERYLPIWIGPYEAEAITIALQDIEVARPQTHDLLKNIINRLGGRLLRVEVSALREDVFYGSLVIEVNEEILEIDSRPSDAFALAVRARVPILVSQDIMKSAGTSPDDDLQNAPDHEEEEADLQPTENSGSQSRLSVFEDFLSNLDIDDLPPEDDAAPDEGPEPGK